MATKIYEDPTTKELVIEDENGNEIRYAAFCEMARHKKDSDNLLITHVPSGRTILKTTNYADLTDSGGTPYANFAALKTALDGYFDATA